MKYIKLFLLLIVTTMVMSSCYEETNWLDENSTSDGNYYPVIQKVIVDAPDPTSVGDSVKVTALYWSKDDIKELQFWATEAGTENLITTWSFTDSFDAEAYAQKTEFGYLVPAGTSGTEIKLTIKVVNKNGLEKDKSSSVAVQ